MKYMILLALCLTIAPLAPAAGQTFEIDLDTVHGWDFDGGVFDGLPAEAATPATTAGPPPQTIASSWTDHNGLNHTVTTARRNGEDVEDWALRHKEAVDGLQEIFPTEAPEEEERGG